jgi:hypothetical protein
MNNYYLLELHKHIVRSEVRATSPQGDVTLTPPPSQNF